MVSNTNTRTRNISVVAAINKFGTIGVKISNITTNAEYFTEYMISLRNKCSVFWKNDAIHIFTTPELTMLTFLNPELTRNL